VTVLVSVSAEVTVFTKKIVAHGSEARVGVVVVVVVLVLVLEVVGLVVVVVLVHDVVVLVAVVEEVQVVVGLVVVVIHWVLVSFQGNHSVTALVPAVDDEDHASSLGLSLIEAVVLGAPHAVVLAGG